MTNYVMKTAKNRGNSRIWLEQKKLSENGFRRGDMLKKTFEGDSLVFTRVSNPISGERYHRIAGTADRPILDCCGRWVTEFMNGAPHYIAAIESGRGTITITPTNGE